MFCAKSPFNCRLCFGKKVTAVVEPEAVQSCSKSSPFCAETDGTIPYAGMRSDPVRLNKLTCLPASPYLQAEGKNSDFWAGLDLVVCPMEEESIIFSYGGDTEYCNIQNYATKDLERIFKNGQEPIDYFTPAQLRQGLEIPMLTSIGEETLHHLASVKQVGDYSEPPKTPVGVLNLYKSVDAPDVVRNRSVNLHGINSTVTNTELNQPSTTTIGLRWTQFDHAEDKGEFEDSVDSNSRQPVSFRPQGPMRFSLEYSSPGCSTTQCTSYSDIVNPNVGHTSTTHEIRWTQFEQETIDATGATDTDVAAVTKFHMPRTCVPDTNYRATANVESVTNSTPASVLRSMYEAIRTESSPRHAADYEHTGSRPIAECSSYHSDHSSLPNELCETQSLKELNSSRNITSRPSYWTPVVGRDVTIDNSTNDASEQSLCSTMLPWLMNLTPIRRFSRSFSAVFDLSSHDSRGTHVTTKPSSRKQQKQTRVESVGVNPLSPVALETFPKPTEGQNVALITCVLSSPPVASEPPSIRIRTTQPKLSVPTFHRRGTYKTVTSRDTAPSQPIRMQHYLVPSDWKQRPVPSAVQYEPYENLEPRGDSQVKQSILESRQRSKLYCIDLNRVGEVKTTRRASPTGRTTAPSDSNRHLECKYVEISLCQNLDGFPTPGALSTSEAQTVHTLLNRRLRNAVVTHLMRTNAVQPSSCKQSNLPANQGDTSLVVRNKTRGAVGKLKGKRIGHITLSGTLFGKKYQYGFRTNLFWRDLYGGAYVFAPGPMHSRPPKPWLVYTHSDHPSIGHSVSAWKIDKIAVHIGGLINFKHHLQAIVSSNDGRLGVVYQHAARLFSQLYQKGLNYSRKSPVGSNPAGPEITIRILVHSPILTKLIATAMINMSPTVGVDDPGISISLNTQSSLHAAPLKSETVSIYATTHNGFITSDCVSSLILCLKRLQALQQELLQSAPTLNCHVLPVETTEYLLDAIYHQSSYACEFVQWNTIRHLRDLVTPHLGTLSHCIRVNAYCPTELYPRACDPDAYQIFRPLFDRILKRFCCTHRSASQPAPSYTLPQKGSLKVTISNALSYRVRFCRNLDGFGFPPVMTYEDYLAVENLCREALLSWNGESPGCWYALGDLQKQNPKLYVNLQRKRLLMTEQTNARKIFGTGRFWPCGRSIYVAADSMPNCDLVVHINGDDHLRVVSVDWTGKQPHHAYNRAVGLVGWLDTKLRFSKSPRWGFLSPAPINTGTGMKFTCCLRVSSTGRDAIPAIVRACDQCNLRICSLNSQGSPVSQHTIIVVPSSSIGATEAAIAIRFLHSLQELSEML